MAIPEPLVRFYDLSGPKPWSPATWHTRYVLNYKGIPYETIKLSYPAIAPKCAELFPDVGARAADFENTVPIIEILGPNYIALNDSGPITYLLNKRFTAEMGYRDVKDVDFKPCFAGRAIFPWIVNDVYEKCLDPSDGSKEFFKTSREKDVGCRLEDILEVYGKGEEACLVLMKELYAPLREFMKDDDPAAEPTYRHLYEASNLKWIQAASPEKYQKVLELYGDDTFTKLMKKVEKYE